MYICVILCLGQKILVPCERNITSDTLKGLKVTSDGCLTILLTVGRQRYKTGKENH